MRHALSLGETRFAPLQPQLPDTPLGDVDRRADTADHSIVVEQRLDQYLERAAATVIRE